MGVIETTSEQDLERVLRYVQPAVRSEHPYIVGGTEEVAVKLNQNESPYDLPEDFKRELLEAFMAIPFNRYPAEQPTRLAQALAAQLGCSPEAVLVGNGSNELTYALGLTIIRKGTPVVLPRPMFSLYEKVVRLYEGDLTVVAPRPDLHFDTDALLEAVARVQPALTVLTSPNNPTGLAMPLRDIARIVEEAPGFVLVDEAYVEFNEEESALTLLEAHPNLLILRTFSKAAGLAGLRLGYMVADPAVIREFMKARLPFMVDRLAEATALALLRRPVLLADRVAELKRAGRALTAALQAVPGVTVVPSQANFVIFKTNMEPAALLSRLAEAGVLVRSMSGYPELRGYLRVNVGTPRENKLFLAALKNALLTPTGA